MEVWNNLMGFAWVGFANTGGFNECVPYLKNLLQLNFELKI